MREPLVSIIIPAYNGEKHLGDAIESILNQNYSHYEIWVIDNGSTDKTKQVAHSFPQVNYVYSDIADTAIARNRGISQAQGEYIAFLDQDDTWVKDKLSKQIAFLESQKHYGAVIGLQKMYLEPGYAKPHWLKQSFLENAQPGYLPSALLVRRSTFELTDHFDTAFSFASDVAWFFKATHSGILIGNIDEALVNRRIHDENTSNKCSILQKQILEVIKASLQERRKVKTHG
jgi:glycosyltransferase involved in cell wall biosynthesis